MSVLDSRIDQIFSSFSQIYLGGIPSTITNDSAFLSFISVLTAIEALAGYRYSEEQKAGVRFKDFVRQYFPDEYGSYVNALWDFRNAIVHAFSTGPFSLTHHRSDLHLRIHDTLVILNAEDFYGALWSAARNYFTELRTSPDLQGALIKRIEASGGPIRIVQSAFQ